MDKNNDLVKYISGEQAKGVSNEVIKNSLRSIGWKDEQFSSYFVEQPVIPQPVVVQPTIQPKVVEQMPVNPAVVQTEIEQPFVHETFIQPKPIQPKPVATQSTIKPEPIQPIVQQQPKAEEIPVQFTIEKPIQVEQVPVKPIMQQPIQPQPVATQPTIKPESVQPLTQPIIEQQPKAEEISAQFSIEKPVQVPVKPIIQEPVHVEIPQTQPIQQTSQPTPIKSNFVEPTILKTEHHWGKKILFVLLFLLLLAGGASAYYYRNDLSTSLMNLPFIKDTFYKSDPTLQSDTQIPQTTQTAEQPAAPQVVPQSVVENDATKAFTAYIKDLIAAKNFDEQIIVIKKDVSKSYMSELDKEFSQMGSDKNTFFTYEKMLAGFFYAVTKSEINGLTAVIESSSRSVEDPSVVATNTYIETKMVFENGAWKVDSVHTESYVKPKDVVVSSSVTTTGVSNIYSNSTYKFSFQYPKSWEFNKVGNGFDTLDLPLNYSPKDKEQLGISITSNITSSLPQTEYNLKKEGIQYTKDIISINGVQVTRIIYYKTKTLSEKSYHERNYELSFSDKRVDFQNNGVYINGNCSTFMTGGGECSTAINDVMKTVVSTLKFN